MNVTSQQFAQAEQLVIKTIANCQASKSRLKAGTPSYSLLENRLDALNISRAIITDQSSHFPIEQLRASQVQIESIISKSQSGLEKAQPNSSTATRFKNLISGFTIVLELINNQIATQSKEV